MRKLSTLARRDLDRSPFARMDPMQDRLFGKTVCLRDGCQLDPATRSIGHRASDDLVGDVDALKGLSHHLIRLEGALTHPASNRVWADGRHVSCLLTLIQVGSL